MVSVYLLYHWPKLFSPAVALVWVRVMSFLFAMHLVKFLCTEEAAVVVPCDRFYYYYLVVRLLLKKTYYISLQFMYSSAMSSKCALMSSSCDHLLMLCIRKCFKIYGSFDNLETSIDWVDVDRQFHKENVNTQIQTFEEY